MNKNNQDKGFTLVELLIVIVILGILATVTVFAVRGITDQGQKNACDVEGRTLSTAIESYYAQNQEDPAVLADLDELLKETPDAAKWTFVAPTDGADNLPGTADDTPASFTAIGKCAA